KLSSLLSKGAFLSSFIPLLAFVVGNCTLLASVHYPFRRWIVEHKTNAEVISVAVVFFLVASLIFASINTRLRELLEGKFVPARLCAAFTQAENQRLAALNAEYTRLQKNRRQLDKDGHKWTQTLLAARLAESKAANRHYDPNGEA